MIFDLEIEHYNETELINLLKMNKDLEYITEHDINTQLISLKKQILYDNNNQVENANIKDFFDKISDKLTSFIVKRDAVQLPPTNYNILQSQNQLSGGNHMVTSDKIIPVQNTTEYKYPVGVLNPLEKRTITKIINIDTAFRENYNSTNPNKFIWTLPQKENNVVRMKIAALELPVMWYDISKLNKNNSFQLKLYNMTSYDDNTFDIEIPDGNYNNVQLTTAINQIFLNIGNGLQYIVLDINPISTKTVIRARNTLDIHILNPDSISPYDTSATYYSPNFYFEIFFYDPDDNYDNIVFLKSLGNYMGFKQPYYKVVRSDIYIDKIHTHTSTATFEAYLSSESSYSAGKCYYFYIAIDDFNKNSVVDTISPTNGNISIGNILGRISINTPVNEILINNKQDFIFTHRDYLGPITLSRLKIQILDKYGQLMDLNNNDFSIALELTILY